MRGKILKFICGKVEEANADGVLTGLSGGVDSAVTTKLCVEALGADRVFTLLMPDKIAPRKDIEDAKGFAEGLGIKYELIDISKLVENLSTICSHRTSELWVLGNLKARSRMIIAYYHANRMNKLVVGSANRSELVTGYFTKYGDGGVDLLPIGHLYKSQVYELARELKIPKKIIGKTPSAGLWLGQKDEEELGLPYNTLDKVLVELEKGKELTGIAKKLKVDLLKIERIKKLIQKNLHKRAAPPTPGG